MPSIRWGLGTGAELCVPFTGNATLSGCRVIGAGGADDDVALAWDEAAVDANTVGLWRMNEAAWNGTAGEVLDASGNGYHGQSYNGANTETGWMDRHGDFATSTTSVVECPAVLWGDVHTVDMWWYPFSAGLNNGFAFTSVWVNGTHLRRVDLTGNYLSIMHGANLPFSVVQDTWHHIAMQYERTGLHEVYIDGQLVASAAPGTAANVSGTVRIGGWSASSTSYWNQSYIDEARVSNVRRYSSTFSPARYKSAAQNDGTQPYALASYAGLTGMVPSAVSWSATTGSGYGQVKRVWVNGSAGWVQVGGDYPISPVAVSGLVLPSADAVRVELEPEQVSGIQNETPVLDWVQLEYVPPSGGRVYRPTPFRLGPKLLPIGVLA